MPKIRVTRALLSVSDKTGLVALAAALLQRGVQLVSTGGTHKALAEAGLPVTEIADFTGFPEMMEGRLKTLHPKVHGGLLARRDQAAHVSAMKEHAIQPIDLLVVNLYPFEATVASGAPAEKVIEMIDIGGPAMIRSAAKNHGFTCVLPDPTDYTALLDELDRHDGATTHAFRARMAAGAFARTAAYDTAIAAWTAEHLAQPTADDTAKALPERLLIQAPRLMKLRYGENPHQAGALYGWDQGSGARLPSAAHARQLQGKELSYNNLLDADAAFDLVAELAAVAPDAAAAVIVKHNNPCGAATGTTLEDAYRRALACDPVAAFGGIVALSHPLDAATAQLVAQLFAEVVIAPAIEPAAQAILEAKKNLRLLATDGLPDPAVRRLTLRSLAGAILVQERDHAPVDRARFKIVTRRAPSAAELADLVLAMTVAKHVRSNAIVLARGGAAVGVGAGQMSRVDSAKVAVRKAAEAAHQAQAAETWSRGAVVASDAFFPFPDGLLVCAEAGVTAAIQPGGSVRDAEVIAAADEHDIAMVFTGTRHFRH